jgi:hypothetical protein
MLISPVSMHNANRWVCGICTTSGTTHVCIQVCCKPLDLLMFFQQFVSGVLSLIRPHQTNYLFSIPSPSLIFGSLTKGVCYPVSSCCSTLADVFGDLKKFVLGADADIYTPEPTSTLNSLCWKLHFCGSEDVTDEGCTYKSIDFPVLNYCLVPSWKLIS